MRISVISQAEVTDVMRAVDGLLHGAQQNRLNHCLIRTISDRFQHLGIVSRSGGISAGQRHAERRQSCPGFFQTILAGRFMDTVETRSLILLQEVGCTGVCHQHHFLNEAMSVIAFARQNLFDLALLIGDNISFNRLKIHRAAQFTALDQILVKIIEILDVAKHVFHDLGFRTVRVAECGPNIVINQSCRRTNHSWVELVGFYQSVGANDRVAHHGAAVNLRIQRTQAVRKLFRQHRDNASREVDTRCS